MHIQFTGSCSVIIKSLSIVFAVIIISIILLSCASSPAEKIKKLSVDDTLSYTLKDKDDGIITLAEYNNGNWEIKVYGKNGQQLKTEDNQNYVYEIGSLTKTITASLICKAQKEGYLNLNDRIDRFLDLPAKTPDQYPTIQELLTHTSGYKSFYFEKGMRENYFAKRNSFYGITKKQMLNRLPKIHRKKAHSFLYSNFGYATLGLILESVYKTSYTTLANDFVHNDLGMTHTFMAGSDSFPYPRDKRFMAWKKDDAYLSAGGFYSTIEDMIIYANHQLNENGIFSDCHKILSEIKNGNKSLEKFEIGMNKICYAWLFDEKNTCFWHNGGTNNYNCYLGFDVKNQKAAIVLSNLEPSYKIPATIVGPKILASR